MTQYKYLRGSQDSREAVEFDITRRGQYITTCVVDVDLLLCGIKAFPCGNGDDVKLTPEPARGRRRGAVHRPAAGHAPYRHGGPGAG